MDKYVDTTLGALLYAFTIIRSRNRQATMVVQYKNGKDHILSGNFTLTIGKKAVILTNDRKPFIVKRWTPLAIGNYLDQSRIKSLSQSKATIAEVYQDRDGWIWEGIVNQNGNHFNIIADRTSLFTISF